ncbi:hypothetical protein SUGI_1148550 [Cryptomeria japonica]|nr:hypothetical protein SUGI_1148550 [Cryptomeria japonica]
MYLECFISFLVHILFNIVANTLQFLRSLEVIILVLDRVHVDKIQLIVIITSVCCQSHGLIGKFCSKHASQPKEEVHLRLPVMGKHYIPWNFAKIRCHRFWSIKSSFKYLHSSMYNFSTVCWFNLQ